MNFWTVNSPNIAKTSSELPPKEQVLKNHKDVNWSDLLLKKELNQAIDDLGFARPSEVQVRAIPKIVQGKNVICQAKSGVGKTAVFVIGILNQMNP